VANIVFSHRLTLITLISSIQSHPCSVLIYHNLTEACSGFQRQRNLTATIAGYL